MTQDSTQNDDVKGLIFDLDGTVYMGDEEVPGAADFVLRSQQRGLTCLFVTNRANRTPEQVAEHLRSYGIPCTADDVLTSSQATARYLKKGSVFYIGEEGLHLALEEAGFTITDEAPDYVIVSFDRGFTYDKLKIACRLIGNGAQFIATNPDRALKTDGGVLPGTGALVAAVAAGTRQEPVMIGKPERLIMDIALERMGMGAHEVVAIGDNMETDIPAAYNAGIRSVLMLTGVSNEDDVAASDITPTWIAEDYAELARILHTDEQDEPDGT